MNGDKVIGLFRLRINGLLQPFRMYGQEVLIPPVIDQIVRAALVLHANLKDDNASKVRQEMPQ